MREGTKVEMPLGMQLSHEEPVWQSLQVLLHGRYGCGKTFLSLTVSEFFTGWKKEKHVGAPVVLEDLAIIGFDKKPVAGLKEHGYSVPQFNVHRFRTTPELWGEAGFKKPPTIIQATEHGLNAVLKLKPRWLILDTVTALAKQLELFYGKQLVKEGEQARKWGRISDSHTDLYNIASSLAPGLITIFHSKAPPMEVTAGGKTLEQKDREEVLVSASGGRFLPAMSGQGIGLYKGDNSICLGVSAKSKGNGASKRLERKLEVLSDKYETKNRFELSLPNEVPCHLGEVLKMIEGNS